MMEKMQVANQILFADLQEASRVENKKIQEENKKLFETFRTKIANENGGS